ncbi:TIGR03751 family conjugal transfer lipoprotein [Aquisalimonas lutea]|uniref:TIGR03751 family conjugal transfer lipoprotein n=1 Tax=Aquisalimonas lutea TaxID=1327750 RepID=UPI0025B2F2AA|nr:TIGR03751 family conjugal transfer lipoprotein [Aquisalimonas lutea]MDN3519015.1 TIGR03751 family conjugal transfer lipoprotein [Aquisalimonas lutea]
MKRSSATTAAWVALISASLAGCASTSKEDVFPEDGPTMREVYDDHFERMRGDDADAARAALRGGQGGSVGEADASGDAGDGGDDAGAREPSTGPHEPRPVRDGPADLAGYTRTARNEIRTRFSQVPNPTLAMYVYPHLAGPDEAPVPGYMTAFSMYQQDHYALPGEAEAQ